MRDDFQRAQQAITALQLTGHNRELAGQWLSFWKDGAPPPLATYRRLTWLHTEGTMICRIHKDAGIECLSAGPYLKLIWNRDVTGMDILSLLPSEDRDELLSFWWQVAQGAICVTYREFKTKDAAPAVAQSMGLPFSDEEPDGSRYGLLHTNWRPSGSAWIVGNVEGGMVAATRRLIRFRGPD